MNPGGYSFTALSVNTRPACARPRPQPISSVLAAVLVLALASWSPQTPAQAAAPAAASAASAASAAAGESRAPSDWIEYTDETVTPVVDDVTEHLAAARAALTAKEQARAATSLQAAARALQGQADEVGTIERRRAAADMTLARDTHARMTALVKKIDATAAQVAAGKITTTAQLDRTIDKAARADLDRRWLVSDVTTWYPVGAEPQRHFDSALALYAKKDFKGAANEVRRAAAYVRLESARAIGDVKTELDGAAAALQRSAHQLDTGAVKSAATLQQTFARADHALATAHRAKAAENWSRKAYDKAGYELKAAAHGVSAAAAWSTDTVKHSAATAATEAHATGDKLARGGVWARDEVARAFDALGKALDRVGESIGVKKKAQPFDTGA